MSFSRLTIFILSTLFFFIVGPKTYGQESSIKDLNPAHTFDNLNSAYIEENTALQRNLTFAQKAEEENLPDIANLFRLAADSKQVTLTQLAEYLKTVDIEPVSEAPPVATKSTLENLKTAWQLESYNRDIMYPRFIEQAKAVQNVKATELFLAAKNETEQYVKTFEQAIGQLTSEPLESVPTP